MSRRMMVVGSLVVSLVTFGSYLTIAAARAQKVVRIYDVAYRLPPAPAPTATPVPAGLHFDSRSGDYSTRFAEDRNRAHNVRLAASAIDGIVIPPGATFSFNDTTGPRTMRRGY